MKYIFLLTYSSLIAFSPYPIATSLNPMLGNENPPGILFAGNEPRYSSCSGVTWSLDDRFLYSVHLFGETISTFVFDKEQQHLESINCRGNESGFGFNHPENVDISPGGQYIAVSQGGGGGCIKVFFMKEREGIFDVTESLFTSLKYTNREWFHGVTFSEDGNYLACTSISQSSCICIYKLIDGNYQKHQIIRTKNSFLKPKGVAFSKDNKFLIACFCQTIGKKKQSEPIAQLEVYPFNTNSGKFKTSPISKSLKTPGNMETIKFSKDGMYLLSTDQVLNEISKHEFDIETGILGDTSVFLKNPEAKLSFPHGLAFSRDGKFLAVTNYGNNSINIYDVENK